MRNHRDPEKAAERHKNSILPRVAALLLVLIFCFFTAGQTAFAAGSVSVHSVTDIAENNKSSAPPQTVHVGFFSFPGYHDMDNTGEKSGYGYDFLQMIAGYANFKYVYVGYQRTWFDMLNMLEDGDIDMLTYAPKIASYEERFDYSEHSIGTTSAILTTSVSSKKFAANEYQPFAGMRVGFIRGTDRSKGFAKYAKQRGITYKAVYYSSLSDMEAALKEGTKIDAMVTDDMREMTDEIIIDKFDQRELYVIVKKGNTDLLTEIDEAIKRLNTADPSWELELESKYFLSDTSSNQPVTLSESEYVKSLKSAGKTLKVLFNPARYPLAYYENGKAKGVLVDIFKQIAGNYDIPYKFIKTNSIDDYYKMRDNGEADIVLDFAGSTDEAEVLGYRLTSEFANSSYSMVTAGDFRGTAATAAIIRESDTFTDIAKNYSARIKIKYYDTFDECIQAVKKGEADCTFMYSVTAQMFMLEDNDNAIKYRQMNDTKFYFRMAVTSSADMLLYGMLNKATHNLDTTYVDQVFNSYLMDAKRSYTLWDYLVDKPALSVGIVILVLLILIMFIIVQRKNGAKLKASNDALNQSRNDLENALAAANDANAAKTIFLSQMSHDIRTPLNGIIGMTQIARENIGEPDKADDALDKISRSSDHLLTLINDILDLSRIESGKMAMAHEPVDIRVAINQCMDVLKSSAINRDLKIVTEIPQIEYPYVLTDALHLRQILINIISNAVKFTPDGGMITFKTEASTDEENKLLFCRFEIADTGKGMSEDFTKRIFEPFVQADEFGGRTEFQGSGLGMAIVKQYVDMMGGTITIRSKLGEGSTFVVDLPFDIDQKAGSVSENEREEIRGMDFTGVSVLLVEDNSINMEIARFMLESKGMKVDMAGDGRIALEKFQTSTPGDYDCILMDIMMPNMNGYEATMAIRALDRADAKTIPIFAMTANAFAEDVKAAMDCGMNGHIAKPIDMNMLLKTLSEFIH